MSNISPEEKLLRLIKGQIKAADDESLINVPLKKGITDKKSTKEKKDAFINIKKINGLFIIVIVLLIFYFTWEQILFKQKLKVLPTGETQKVQKITNHPQIYTTLPDFSHYSEVIGKRDLFTASGRKMQLIQEDTTKKMQEMVKNLSLIGIVWEHPPQAIIEDKGANKTYFLYKGDRLGDFQIKEIFENKVLLIYEGQEIELAI